MMKKLRFPMLIALASLLMAADCNTDAEYYNDVFVAIPNLINVETQSSFEVGDYLEINTDGFSRVEQDINGQAIDVYRSSGFAPSVSFTYVFEKRDGDLWIPVNFGNSIQQVDGLTSSNEEFILARSVFNFQTETYDYKAQLPLTASGSYRLRFNYSGSLIGFAQLRTDSSANQLYINIASSISGLNSEAIYNFEVN